MSKSKKWLAVVRDERWTLAKVQIRKGKLAVLHMSELELRKPEAASEAMGGAASAAASGSMERAIRLKTWFRQEKVPLKQLKLAVSYFGLITRIVVLPKMATKDLHKLLTEHVDQYFTLNIDDYLVDYRVIEHFVEEEQEKLKVLLAALPKSRWTEFYQTCLDSGFKPKVVDLALDSTIRFYGNLSKRRKANRERGNGGTGSDWAIVDLSGERVEYILLEQGKFFLYSDMEWSLEGLTEALYEYKALRLAESSLEQEERDALLESRQGALKTGLEAALSPVLRTMGEFFNFFAARHFGKSIDQVFITGSYADLPFLEELFADNLGIEAHIGFPDGWRPRFHKRVRGQETQWMKHASLYGLAFRED